jgi:hypothetical protein
MKALFPTFIAFVLFAHAAFAQTVSIKNFLGTAESDMAVKAQMEQAGVMKNASGRIPLIRDVEVKIRNRAFEEQKFQYVVQVTPEGFGEGRALKNLFKSQSKLTEQQVQLLVNKMLLIRYNDVIDFLDDCVTQKINSDLITVLQDKIAVVEKKTAKTDFDLNTVIMAEDELTKIQDQNIDLAKEIKVLTREIRQFLSDSNFTRFDTAGLVDVESVSVQVKLPTVVIDTENVYLNNDRLKLRVSEGKYDLEKAQQDGRYLSSITFCYNYDRYINENDKRINGKLFDLNNAYYLELGFRLPFITRDGRNVAQRKEALLSANSAYNLALRDLVDRMKKDVDDIGSFIAQYRYLKARENEVDAQASLKKYYQMSGVDPLMLLLINQGIMENRLRIEKVRYDILRNYIRVLDSTGELSKRPLRNFLSASKELLAP